MKQEVITVTDCNRCPHRYAETGEYPSDRCRLNGSYLDQHTVCAREDDPIPPPRGCPLRKKDHVVKISRRYRFGLLGVTDVATPTPTKSKERWSD